MSLIAESIVDEYYNYNGFFTIRGAKQGVNEIDLLAIKVSNKNKIQAFHIEVQVSLNPVSYISSLTDDVAKKLGAKSRSSAIKRANEDLRECVKAWIDKKYNQPVKVKARKRLYPIQKWEYIFVHGIVKEPNELDFMEELGIKTINIREMIDELISARLKKHKTSSVGREIINLISLYSIKDNSN